MFTQFIFALIFIVSILQLLALKGSFRDILICTCLRILFLAGVTILWFSPRFEDITRSLELPRFAILLDQSMSVRPFQEQVEKKKSALSNFLGQWGTIQNASFPEQAMAHPADSITNNLNALCQEKNYRAIFIITDGQESHQGIEKKCNSSVFLIPAAPPMDIYDSGMEPVELPFQSYIGQEINIKTKVYANRSEKLLVKLHLNQTEIAQREVISSLAGETVEFKLISDQAGRQKLSLSLSSMVGGELTRDNNELSWPLTVHEKSQKLLVLAQSPSFELSQFLALVSRIPSLQFEVHYPNLHPELSPSEYQALIIWGGLKEYSLKPFLKNIPTLTILDSNSPLIAVLPQKLQDILVQSTTIPTHLKVHDLELLSQLEGITSVLETLRPPAPAYVPASQAVVQTIMSLDSDKTSVPLVFMLPHKSEALWVVSHPGLMTMDFFPSSRTVHQEFVAKLFTFLVSSLSSKNLVDGIDIHDLPQILMEGERLSTRLNSKTSVVARLVNHKDQPIWASSLPATLDKVLKHGTYQLQFTDATNQRIREETIVVGIAAKEMTTLGNSWDWLRKTAGTKGKILDSENSLLQQIPSEILQKQLRMQKRTIDLQANWIWLLLLVSAISLEWVYRYKQRMV